MDYFVYQFQAFLLIMVRMHTMFMVAPFYSSDIIPFRLKALLAFFVSLIIFPLVTSKGFVVPGNIGEYWLMVIREIIVGVYIGTLASFIFTGFQLAGQYFSAQVGFGMSEVLDPLAQVSIPIIGQFLNLIGVLVFLTIGGHHFLIKAVYHSYELAPVVTLGSIGGLLKFMAYSFSGMFVVALKIALPVMATVFLIEVSMGVLSKAAPQMNIMMLGFPFKILVAFGMLAMTAPLIVRIMRVSLERNFQFIEKVLVNWPT